MKITIVLRSVEWHKLTGEGRAVKSKENFCHVNHHSEALSKSVTPEGQESVGIFVKDIWIKEIVSIPFSK